MPINCNFVFTRSTPIFYSGEQISGYISLNTSKRLPLQAIELTFLGIGHVQWSAKSKFPQIEHNDCTDADNQIQFSGKQEYNKESLQLAANTTLQPETGFVANFQFTVPEHCPATCKQNYGEVAYMLQLILRRSGLMFNKVFQRSVVIKNRLDLNCQTKLKEHCSVQSIAQLGCTNQALELSVNCTGFVPGQLLKYRLQFGEFGSSNSAYNAYKVLVNICQCIVYTSHQPDRKTKEVIKTLACNKHQIVRHTFGQIEAGVLRIPLAVPITTINEKSLMSVSYYLEAVIMFGRNTIMQRLRMPITIGTIALGASTFVGEDCVNFCYDNLASSVVQSDANKISTNVSKCAYENNITVPIHKSNNEMIVLKSNRISDKFNLLSLKINNKHFVTNIAEHAF